MPNVIRIKRSAVASKVPVTGDLQLGELAINTFDGKLYTKKDNGTASIVEIGAGGSGSGLSHFVESESTTSPNATIPVDALTATDASYTNIDVALVPKGTGAILAQVPDSTITGGNKRGAGANDFQKTRTVATQVASGVNSVICGGVENTASNLRAIVGGGQANLASGSGSAIVGGNSNTASAINAFVGGGNGNTSSTQYSSICGGSTNTSGGSYSAISGGFTGNATGDYSFIGGGRTNTTTGLYSTISGGRSNTADSPYSVISGGNNGTTRGVTGYHAFPACEASLSLTAGASQGGYLILARQTTSETATILASDPLSPSTTNQVVLPNNSAYLFSGEIIAGVTGAGNASAWEFKGAIKRGANAASTSIVGSVVLNRIAYDAGAAAWGVAITADTTNGCIKVEVTGAASTTIRWVCKIQTTEMTY